MTRDSRLIVPTTEVVDYLCDEPGCPNGFAKHYHAVVYVVDDPNALDAEELSPAAPWNDTSW
jgi:hypothetical protein